MLSKIRDIVPRLLRLDRRLDEIKINQGIILSELRNGQRLPRLFDYGFKVFSQWDEDGILQHLTRNLEIRNHTFIEFGVEDFFESNCRFLLMKDRWSGLVIDGSETNIERLRSSYFYWRFPLQSIAAFITRENVESLLDKSGFDKELGILSVDVDGIDYYLLEALADWRASIVVVEYNAIFGAARRVTVPYDSNFQRNKAHASNLYYGASLAAFWGLLEKRGYALIGVNSVGSNAFFVRRELLNERVKEVSVSQCFRESSFREGRHANGELILMSAKVSASVISALPIVDLDSNQTIRVSDILPET